MKKEKRVLSTDIAITCGKCQYIELLDWCEEDAGK